MIWYLIMYCIGIAAAMSSPLEPLKRTLAVIGPISMTALIASLLVPFAAFSVRERVQKWCVQYGIVPVFGAYTIVVWRDGGGVLAGLVVLVGSSAVHLGYWLSSLHSRLYRMDLFRKAFGSVMPSTMQLVARLSATGQSHIADQIVTAILRSRTVYKEQIERALVETTDNGNAEAIFRELAKLSTVTP